MAVTKLSQIVKLNGSFRNSINLYLNLNKKEKIDSYIPTKSSLNILKRYVGSVIKNKDHSTILIGSYGKGKSHLLLILLAIVSMQRTKENNEIVKSLLKKIRMVDEETFEIVSSVWNKKGRFLPVIISGSIDDVINKMANEAGIADDERMKKVREARINSLDIFKSKGKELQCIIPISGPFERFTLSEDTIRFLVLSLIQPGDKMTLKMFLEKLYQNYRIVIGPEEYRKSMQDSSMDSSLANSFSENVVAFQQFLRSTGFLKELSDATSIVINPYEPIEEVIS